MRIFLERAERRYGPMDGPVDGGSDGVPRLAGDDEPTLPMRARGRLSRVSTRGPRMNQSPFESNVNGSRVIQACGCRSEEALPTVRLPRRNSRQHVSTVWTGAPRRR